ncbi:MAG: ABC transporter ATP-binding protein [Rhodospirillales bacterium]|nr:ABC transporter ATP-binding protein [Rhodospirillales bacterium]
MFRLNDVCYAYEPHRPVLNNVNLILAPGERLAVRGGNGAGKTTLLHLMVGLLKPVSGTVVAFGKARHTEADFREVRARAGLLFQDPDDQLFCPTVAEDVAFGPLNLGKSRDETRTIVERTLASLGLDGFEDRITHKLSGGEKRLVSLATVLAMDPDVLLLDEPTNALDEQAEARLLEILLGLPQAMVIICHDNRFRDSLANRSVVLKDGDIATL